MTVHSFVLRDAVLEPAPALAVAGLAHGYGLFETLRSYAGRLFHLDEHLARMRAGAARLNLEGPPAVDAIEPACAEALERAELRDARVRLLCVAAEGGSTLWMSTNPLPAELVIQVQPVEGYLTELQREGAKVIVSSHRIHENSIVSGVKTIGYAGHILAKREAVAAGAHETLIRNSRDEVVEGSMSNVFIVVDGALATPSLACGPLAGVTRHLVLELARKAGIDCREARFGVSAIKEASESFLTSSVAEIVPVVRLGREAIGDEVPGEITRALQTRYRRLTES